MPSDDFVLAGQIASNQSEIIGIKGGLHPLAVCERKSSSGILNGQVPGTGVGYWIKISNYHAFIFDVTAYQGKTISIYGTYNTNAYKHVFCKDYKTLPTSLDEYNENATLWTENMVSAVTARGTTSGGDYTTVTTVPDGANYLILQGNASKTPTADIVIAGELPELRQELARVDVLATSVESMEADVAAQNLQLNGNVAPMDTKPGFAIDNLSSSANIGSWTSVNYTVAYIYDVTAFRGSVIKTVSWCRQNTFLWAFVKNWKDIQQKAATESNGWAENKVSANTSRSPNTSGTTLKYTFTVPEEASHLILLGWNGQVPSVKTTDGLESRVSALESGSVSGTDIVTLNGDGSHLSRLKAMRHANYNGNTPLMLAHFSDIHGSTVNLKRIVEWTGHYSAYLDDVIHTGDNMAETWLSGFGFWTDVDGAEKILNCIGNHDTNDGNGNWSGIAAADAYARYMAPYMEIWGATPAGEGLCYYYKDYTASKVRLVVLDCMHRTVEQDAWFVEVLEDARSRGLSVIGAYHCAPCVDAAFEMFDCNFSSPNFRGSSIAAYPRTALVNAVEQFKADGGDFCCWIGGHTHRDYAVMIDNSQLCFLVDTAQYSTYHRDHVVEQYTKSQDCFNVIAVDNYLKTVKLLRVGSDTDYNLRHIGTLCVRYTDGKILSEW